MTYRVMTYKTIFFPVLIKTIFSSSEGFTSVSITRANLGGGRALANLYHITISYDPSSDDHIRN